MFALGFSAIVLKESLKICLKVISTRKLAKRVLFNDLQIFLFHQKIKLGSQEI